MYINLQVKIKNMKLRYTASIIIFLGISGILVLNAQQQKQKMKLIYVYDALCGWCYGFKPTMQQFAANHASDLEVEVISGGMITGSRIGPIGEVAPYISWAYKEVEKATGVKFGDGFLNNILANGKAVFTSIPPAQALCAFKNMNGNNTLAFAARLQKAIYYDGLEPLNIAGYGKLAKEFNLDSTRFVQLMQEEITAQQVQLEFNKATSYGVTGFPTVFILANNKMYKLTEGYTNLENLEKSFNTIKKQIQ
jgi:putative protein-disulfide isomerase